MTGENLLPQRTRRTQREFEAQRLMAGLLLGFYGTIEVVPILLGQSGRALGNRVWKSRRPTHSGLIVIRTMEETIAPRFLTQAFP